MDRERRFEYTLRHCLRAKALWMRHRIWWVNLSPEKKMAKVSRALGYFRKNTGAGCRGSKKGSASSSKMGSCCKGGYRETVRARHAARRLCKAWTSWAASVDDFNDSRF
jgi:hypothetical protein